MGYPGTEAQLPFPLGTGATTFLISPRLMPRKPGEGQVQLESQGIHLRAITRLAPHRGDKLIGR